VVAGSHVRDVPITLPVCRTAIKVKEASFLNNFSSFQFLLSNVFGKRGTFI